VASEARSYLEPYCLPLVPLPLAPLSGRSNSLGTPEPNQIARCNWMVQSDPVVLTVIFESA